MNRTQIRTQHRQVMEEQVDRAERVRTPEFLERLSLIHI